MIISSQHEQAALEVIIVVNVVRVECTRNLCADLILSRRHRLLGRFLIVLVERLVVVPTPKLRQLDQKVAHTRAVRGLLHGHIEKTLNARTDLVLGQVFEMLAQHVGEVDTHVLLVAGYAGLRLRVPQRRCDPTAFDQAEEMSQDFALRIELRFVQAVREHIKDLIEIGSEELRIVRLVELRRVVHVLKKGVEQLQTSVSNVAVRVFESSHDRINDIFLWCDVSRIKG